MKIQFPFWNYHDALQSPVTTVLACFIVITMPFCLSATETILHRYSAEEPDRQLENVLYLTAGVALSQAGFSSTRSENDADYILLTGYASAGSILEIRYTFYRTNAPERILAVAEFELPIDYNLDQQITGAVRQVLQLAGMEAVPSETAEIAGLLPELSPDKNGAKIQNDSLVNEIPGATEILNNQIDWQAPVVRFDSCLSAALVMLLGAITEYFHYSAAVLLTAGITWPRELRSFTLGAKLAFMRVFNDADVTGGPLYLSTAGINLQFGMGANRPYRAAVGVTGGAALMTVAGGEKTLTKTVPYTDVGVHISILIGKHFSLGGEIRFLLIFDDELLIMGISPTLSLGMEV